MAYSGTYNDYFEVEWNKPQDIKGEGITKGNWCSDFGFTAGHTPWNKGKNYKLRPLTEQHKLAIGLGNKGKTISEDCKKKMSVAATGRVLDKATRKKIGDTQRGRTKLKEHANNIAKAVKGRIHVTDGTTNKFVHPSNIPAGFKAGRTLNKKK